MYVYVKHIIASCFGKTLMLGFSLIKLLLFNRHFLSSAYLRKFLQRNFCNMTFILQ